MEKKRVEKGERYWCVGEDMNPLEAVCGENWALDVLRLKAGNCYTDYHECYVMCGKLRAVLAGAEVIRLPSEEEISQQATDIAWNRQDDYYDEEENLVHSYGECYDSAKDMYKWLKSKIIK